MDPRALGHDLVDRLAGVERAGRVLEDELRLAAERSAARLGSGRRAGRRMRIVALGRRLQAEDGPRQGRLAAAGLADQGERPRRGGPRGRRRRRPGAGAALAAGRVVHLDVLQLEQQRVARSIDAGARCASHRPLRPARSRCSATGAGTSTHAARRPSSPAGRSSTSVTAALVAHAGQRGWKGQPDGTAHRIGRIAGQARTARSVTPGRRWSGRRRPGARVYGCGGSRSRAVGRALLDDAAGVHHRQPVGDGGQHREVVGDEDHRQPPLGLDLAPAGASTWACTITSSAVVGSSAISRRGSQARAMAIITRCFWPPDSSCG